MLARDARGERKTDLLLLAALQVGEHPLGTGEDAGPRRPEGVDAGGRVQGVGGDTPHLEATTPSSYQTLAGGAGAGGPLEAAHRAP